MKRRLGKKPDEVQKWCLWTTKVWAMWASTTFQINFALEVTSALMRLTLPLKRSAPRSMAMRMSRSLRLKACLKTHWRSCLVYRFATKTSKYLTRSRHSLVLTLVHSPINLSRQEEVTARLFWAFLNCHWRLQLWQATYSRSEPS